MNIGSPLHGVHFMLASGPPFNPLTDIPNLARLMLYKSPYPMNLIFPLGTPCAVDDRAWWCLDQYQSGAPSPQLDETTVTNGEPTFKATGLSYSTDGTQNLVVGNDLMQGGLADWTGYFWGTYAGANFWVPLGNNGTSSAVFIDDSGAFDVYDDAFQDVGALSGVSTGLVLCRFNYNATTGDFNIAATGAGFIDSSVATGKVHSFNYTGQAPGLDPGTTNGSTSNRYRGQLVVARSIILDSAEDLQIRAYIALDNPGYAL